MTTELLEKETATVETPIPASEKLNDSDRIFASFDPFNLRWNNIDWVVLGWMVAIHAGALVAPFYFTWQALGVAAVLFWLCSSVGICLGYHRYLSHRSLKLKPPAEFFVLLCGVLSGQGTPLSWAATHRVHHQRSDMSGDPHSPLDGRWWSHILWLFVKHTREQRQLMFRRYIPDHQHRPLVLFFEKTFGLWLVATAVTMFLVGGLPMLLWAVCLRMTLAYHFTWLVNSATHLWGYRNYETTDESRNLWWVAILAFGEGWHNNHHAHPSIAPAGHRWWEFDMTWWVIKALRAVGLATDVKDKIPQAS